MPPFYHYTTKKTECQEYNALTTLFSYTSLRPRNEFFILLSYFLMQFILNNVISLRYYRTLPSSENHYSVYGHIKNFVKWGIQAFAY